MSSHTLKTFVVANSGGQLVAIYPKAVRCLFGPEPNGTAGLVTIDLGGPQHRVTVEGQLRDVAASLGFRLTDAGEA
jgi:hypothetical protein